MNSEARVIRFEEDVHTALWGVERWLVSAHPRAPGRVVGENRTLADLCPGFPLLIKEIRAGKRLSVQVHPNERTAASVGGEPKTEMWCVLEPGPIFAGFRPGVTDADVRRAVKDGTFEELLVRFDTKPGECYFIPGGLVHAIGEGTTVFEVQQSSDTTFRLYDWGRVDAEGKPRELHVEAALAAMDLAIPPPVPCDHVDCAYFSFAKHAGGEVRPDDAWRAVFLPGTRESLLLPPGAGTTLTEDCFITRPKFRDRAEELTV